MLLSKATFWLVAAPLASAALPPSQDPFYQPPTGWESTAPGTILNSRTLASAVDGATTSYQLLFRSTNSRGDANAVVTTILKPAVADPKKLLSFQAAYDSVDVDCSPSYTLQTRGNNTTSEPMVASALSNGWYVATPDFEGFDAAFVNGPQSGQAVLDSLRAALASAAITGLASDATSALAGYSGGALGSEWAAELQPSYAPELQIAGAALGGLTPNATSTLFTVNKTPSAILIPLGFLGLTAQDPDMRNYVESQLRPANRSTFNKVLSLCATDVDEAVVFANQDIIDWFVDGAQTVMNPTLAAFIHEYGTMGLRDTPRIPLYVYKGVQDEISAVADTDDLVGRYCAAGASIEYTRSNASNHGADATLGEPGAFSWLTDRMDGVAAGVGCRVTTVA